MSEQSRWYWDAWRPREDTSKAQLVSSAWRPKRRRTGGGASTPTTPRLKSRSPSHIFHWLHSWLQPGPREPSSGLVVVVSLVLLPPPGAGHHQHQLIKTTPLFHPAAVAQSVFWCICAVFLVYLWWCLAPATTGCRPPPADQNNSSQLLRRSSLPTARLGRVTATAERQASLHFGDREKLKSVELGKLYV